MALAKQGLIDEEEATVAGNLAIAPIAEPDVEVPSLLNRTVAKGIEALTPEKSELEIQAEEAGMAPQRFNPDFFRANVARKFAGAKESADQLLDPARLATQLGTGAVGFGTGAAGAVGSLITDAFKGMTDTAGAAGSAEPVVTRQSAADQFKSTFEGINKAITEGMDKLTRGAIHSKRADKGAAIVSGLLEEILHPIHVTAEKLNEAGAPLVGEVFKLGGEVYALGQLHASGKTRVANNPFAGAKGKARVKGTAMDINLLKEKIPQFNEAIKQAKKDPTIDTKKLKEVTLEDIQKDPQGVALALEQTLGKYLETKQREQAEAINRNLFPDTSIATEIPLGDMFKAPEPIRSTEKFGPAQTKVAKPVKAKVKSAPPKKAQVVRKPLTAKELAVKVSAKLKAERLKTEAARRKIDADAKAAARAANKAKRKVKLKEAEPVIESATELINRLRTEYPTLSNKLRTRGVRDTKVKGNVRDVTKDAIVREWHELLNKRPKSVREHKLHLEKVKEFERLMDTEKLLPKPKTPIDINKAVERKVFTPEEGRVLAEVVAKFKEVPNVDIKKSTKFDRINQKTGEIELKDPTAIYHELGHYAFTHILKSKDRIEFLKGMEPFSSSSKNRPRLRDKTAAPPGVVKDYATNVTDNYVEYFGEQFSQYLNNKVMTDPQHRTVMKRVVDYLKKVLTKARKEKLYDEKLQPFFDKIIHANEPLVKPKRAATAKELRLELIKSQVEKHKQKKLKQEEQARTTEEFYDDMVTEMSDHVDLIGDDYLYRKSGIRRSKEEVLTKLKNAWTKAQLEVDLARNDLGKAKKTTAGYSDALTEHYNGVLHDANRFGMGYAEVYARKGVKAYEIEALTKGAEDFASARIKEFEKSRGKQVNPVWKKKDEGIANTPVYAKDLLDMRRINVEDLTPKKFGRGLTLPDVVFDMFGPEVKELIMGRYDTAIDLKAKERNQITRRLKDVKKLVPVKERESLNNYVFAQQHYGKAYLEGLGKKIPKWEELSPEVKVAYEYMQAQYLQFFDRINMARRQNGKKPFGKQDNYATMMRDLVAMEEAGIGDVRMDSAKFKEYQTNERLRETKFNWDKKRGRLVDAEGNPTAIYEADAFKVLDRYSDSALNAIYVNPAVSFVSTLLDAKTKVTVDGKTTWENILGLSNPTAREWLISYNNRVALGRAKRFGEGSGEAALTPAHRAVDTAISYVNQSLTAAYLSLSARLAVTQVAAIGNTIAIAPLDVIPGMLKAFTPGNKSKLFKKSKRLFSTVAGGDAHLNDLKSAVFDTKGKFSKYKDATRRLSEKGLTLTHAMDGLIRRGSWEAFYAQAKRKGMNSHEAMRHADSLTTKTQSSGALHLRAPLQTTAGGKVLTLFQTFTISQYNLLRYDIGAGLVGKGGKGKGGKINFTKGERDYLNNIEKQTGKKVNSEKVVNELRRSRDLAEAMAKAVGVKDTRAISKMDATKMALMFVVGKSLIDAAYEDGLGIRSPNPQPFKEAKEAYVKDESAAEALLAFGHEMGGFVPILSSAMRGEGFGGAAYTAVADVMGARDGEKLVSAATNLLLLPGVGSAKTAIKAIREDEDNPFYYLVRRKKKVGRAARK